MTMRTIAVSLALTMSLTACASHWERSPGHEYADYDQDEARCYLIGRGMPQEGFAAGGGGTGQAGAYAAAGAGLAMMAFAIGRAVQQQKDHDACMTLSGWHKVANQ